MELTNETTPETNEKAGATNGAWAEAAAASEENATALKPGEIRKERVVDVIKVAITDVAKAKIADDNAADDLKKRELEAQLEGLKEDVKSTKAKIDIIDERMSERHEAVRDGIQTLKGEWIVTDIFEQNEVQYTDPETGLVVYTRAMDASERQRDLFDVGSGPSGDEDDDSEGDESGDLPMDGQDDEEEHEGGNDSEPPSSDDETAITNPQGTLDGSAASDAKPKRTRKKKGVS